jgi:peptidoglycan-associated lipoprotein
MKMTKLIYTLALALICAFAATGCAHKPVGLTRIPGQTPLAPPEIGPGPTLGNENGITAASPESFDGMIADRAALAANTIHFAYDSTAIKKSEHANLQAVADALSRDHSLKLLIEGNCDERGTEEYNRALGERRAGAAREALAKMGTDPMRIKTKSYGKDKPVGPGHDEASRAQNRRDDFVLLHPQSGMGGS